MTAVLPHAAASELVRQLPRTLSSYADFDKAIEALAAGQPASIDGVWGSACALVAAALAQASAGPIVVVLPSEREADDLAADLELFMGQEPHFFPCWETAEDERLVHDETFGERLRLVKELLALKGGGRESGVRGQESGAGGRGGVEGRPAGLGRFMKARRGDQPQATTNPDDSVSTEDSVLSTQYAEPKTDQRAEVICASSPTSDFLLITSIQALLQPAPHKADIEAATRTLKKGERVEIDALLRWLVERGFHATSAVELPGEFSHRGGILDIFATDWLRPVRIELFDDEIESLRSFEVATQRSHETLEAVEVTALAMPSGEGEVSEESESGEDDGTGRLTPPARLEAVTSLIISGRAPGSCLWIRSGLRGRGRVIFCGPSRRGLSFGAGGAGRVQSICCRDDRGDSGGDGRRALPLAL